MKKMIVSLTVMVFVFSQNLRAQQPTAVDLGLSVKWANCNLGASRPEGAGNYYTWGDTKKWDNSRTGDSKWYKTRWREGSEVKALPSIVEITPSGQGLGNLTGNQH